MDSKSREEYSTRAIRKNKKRKKTVVIATPNSSPTGTKMTLPCKGKRAYLL